MMPTFFPESTFVLNLVVAALLGALLGLERSLAGKHAGMRTYALVSLGSCLFVITGTLASFELQSFAGINPLQIAGSIAIGIGFIGSGLAIMGGPKQEITTAAGIWIAAAVGMASGYGLYLLALATSILTIVVFSLLSRLEGWIRGRFGTEVE
jgi:putative Mg2+ transporter-C (MgtC) family protein